MSDSLPLAVTMGDPAGCGPALTRRVWRCREQIGRAFCVVGDAGIAGGCGDQAVPTRIIEHPCQTHEVFSQAVPVIQVDCPPVTAGVAEPASAGASIESIRRAAVLVKSGQAAAIVTNPVNKGLLAQSGFAFPGHTEYLAHLVDSGGARHPVMMLVGGSMRIALVTTHLSLRGAIDALTPELIATTCRIVADDLARYFGLTSPRLALAALNPHAGENGAFGCEEADILGPALEAVVADGISLTGPHPADTLFHSLRQGAHDAAIALYHDQGLIPLKTVDFWNGVNTTLGLGLIRTSPDHGVAYDRASTARHDSLMAALKLAALMAKSTKRG